MDNCGILVLMGVDRMLKVLLVEPIDQQAYEYLKEHVALIENIDECEEAEMVINRNLKMNAAFMRKMPKLRKIIVHGTGFDDIDLIYCHTQHIEVVCTPYLNSQSVAELMLGLTLDVYRHITASRSYLENATENENAPACLQGIELKGKTVGFLGSGTTMQLALPLFQAFQTQIIAYSPHLYRKNLPVKSVAFEELFKQSDVLIVALPLNERTYHMIGKEELSLMKSSSIFINVSRGAVVDEKELYHALETQKIAGAGLDVIEYEPITKIHPFYSLPRVVLTPHIGGNTKEALYRIGQAVIHEVMKD